MAVLTFLFAALIASAQIDGPYIFKTANGLRVVRTDATGLVNDTLLTKIPKKFKFQITTHKSKHSFEVALHKNVRPNCKIARSEKIFITSDPHGNFDCFAGILIAGGVIDSTFRWTFGRNQLVVIGDVFDRGNDVVPIFWLLYKLEEEAQQAGGQAIFLLGNHEEMTLRNDTRYAKSHYLKLAEDLGMDFSEMWSAQTVLGSWLRTRNMMQIIGDMLFLHGGVSIPLVERNMPIAAVNDTISRYLSVSREKRNLSETAKFLYGSDGPLWYRGMVRTNENYNPMSKNDFPRVLTHYGVKRIFVGHTINEEIAEYFDGKVIDVNVDNAANRKNKQARAVLLENEKVFLVYDNGKIIERY
ncbi:MAG: metallophosphoesterase [Prevotellaceae bacterium]|nr:metallophosphoesterase [Prevotellaceae bacterium]